MGLLKTLWKNPDDRVDISNRQRFNPDGTPAGNGWDKMWSNFEDNYYNKFNQGVENSAELVDIIAEVAIMYAAMKVVEARRQKLQQEQELQTKRAEQQIEQQTARRQAKFDYDMAKSAQNSKSVFSDEYRVNDLAKFAVNVAPPEETPVMMNMDKKQAKEILKAEAAKTEHIQNYKETLARHGVADLSDCTFYDNTGKEVKPYAYTEQEAAMLNRLSEAAESGELKDVSRLAMYGAAIKSQSEEATIYGLDSGYLKCKLPNGEYFDPSKDPLLKKDDYSKNMDKYEKTIASMYEAPVDEHGVKSESLAETIAAQRAHDFETKVRNGSAFEEMPTHIKSENAKEALLFETACTFGCNQQLIKCKQAAYEIGNPYEMLLENRGANLIKEYNESKSPKTNKTVDMSAADEIMRKWGGSEQNQAKEPQMQM